MNDSNHRPGDHIGPWQLKEILGVGGNASVWRAAGPEADDSPDVAIKILKSKRRDGEPFARFQREIETLKRIGPHPHVLPLVDVYSNHQSEQGARLWYVMPLAEPFRDAVTGDSAANIVKLLAPIAVTLAELLQSLGVSHRDVKPSNLYVHHGEGAISDFGLAEYPDAGDLTSDAKLLGPAHFHAPEMLTSPSSASGEKADVYSFGKTLWVLVADQNWPPPGHQLASSRQSTLSVLRQEPGMQLLDRLIERCTDLDPSSRPSLAEVSAELAAWVSLPKGATDSPDLSLKLAELTRIASPQLTAEEFKDRMRHELRTAARRLEELLFPLYEQLERGFPRMEKNVREKLGETLTRPFDRWGGPRFVDEYLRSWAIRGLRREHATLLVTRWLATTEDGNLHARASVYVGRLDVMGGVAYQWQSEQLMSSAGSPGAEASLVELSAEVNAQLSSALDALVASWADGD